MLGGLAVVEKLLNKFKELMMSKENKQDFCICDCCVKRDVCVQAEAVRKFQAQLLCADVNEFCDDFGVKVKVECTKYVRDKVQQNGH
jgi:hypothetical protein